MQRVKHLMQKIGLQIRRMCYHNVIIGLSFLTVPKMRVRVFGKKVLPFSGGAIGANGGGGMSIFGEFLFSEKRFCHFQGVQSAPTGAEACPKNGETFFWKTRMFIFGT
jgi:hypothetical protein